MQLNIKNAHLILEDFYLEMNPKVEEPKDLNICEQCSGQLQFINHYLTCTSCGLTDLDITDTCYMESYDEYVPKKSLYKRKLYALDKIRMLTCQKVCKKNDYKTSVRQLSKYEFEDILDLKLMMKQLKMNKLYPYIYMIYYDINKVKLIDLKWNQIDRIADEFVKFEIQFKTSAKTSKRKNMLSYYSIIYLIMKRLNYDGYQHIILPNNFDQMEFLTCS